MRAKAGIVEGSVLGGRYRVVGLAGRGGGGSVYVVEDLARPGRLALKLTATPGDAQRAVREFGILSRLGHPNLAGVQDLGVLEDHERACYYTRRWVEGEPLDRAIVRGDASMVKEALSTLLGVLDYLHVRGVVHQDIKPDNIICPPHEVTRLELIDFGMARTGSSEGCACGSPAYMDPRVIEGAIPDCLSDLYSLGATMAHVVNGRPPFEGGSVRDVLESKRGSPVDLPGWLDADTAETIGRLCAADPARRFTSARAGLERLGVRGAEVGPVVLPGTVMVGFDGHMASLRERLGTPGSVVLVRGGTGSGKSRLTQELGWQAQIDGLPVLRAWFTQEDRTRPIESLMAQLGMASSLREGRTEGDLVRTAEAMSRALFDRMPGPGVVVLEDLHFADTWSAEVVAYLIRATVVQGGPMIVVTSLPHPAADRLAGIDGANVIDLASLGVEDTARMVGLLTGRPAPRLAAAIHAAVGGIPLAIEETVRQLALAGRLLPDEMVDVATLALPSSVQHAVLGRLDLCEKWQRSCVELGAVYGRPWDLDVARAHLDGDLPDGVDRTGFEAAHDRLVEDGILARVGASSYDFLSPGVREIVRASCPAPRRRALHARFAGSGQDVLDPTCVLHLVRSGPADPDRAASLALASARALGDSNEHGRAELLLREALTLDAPAMRKAELCQSLAGGLCAVGRFDEALDLLDGVASSLPAGTAHGDLLARMGFALEAKGSYASARLRLEAALEKGVSPGRMPAVADVLAKVEMMTGMHERAREVVEKGLAADPDDDVACSLHRTRALVASYEGRSREATDEIELALDIARSAGDRRGQALTESTKAMILQRDGRTREALAHYRASQEMYESSGYVGGLPVLLMNMGTIHYQLGEISLAMSRFEASLALARRMDKVSTATACMINIANLEAYCGATRQASHGITLALELARRHFMRGFEARALLCSAEIALVEERLDEASSLAGEAIRAFEELGSGVDLVEARVLASEVDLGAGRVEKALAGAEAVAREARSMGHTRFEASATIVQGRCLDATAGRDADALAALRRALDLATGGSHEEQRWRAHAALAGFHLRRGSEALGHRHAADAMEILAGLSYAVPVELRAGFWQRDPGRREVQRLTRGSKDASAHGKADGERALAFLEINRRILDEDDTQRLLEIAMDTAVSVLGAERGFLILKDAAGKTSIAAARNIDRETIRGARLKISRSIAEEVAASGNPLLTTSAEEDERFSSTRSVHELRLKSVMCVPIRGRERVLGTIYLDNRFMADAFTARDMRLVLAFADVIAVALENLSMMETGRRRERELEDARARLDDLLSKKTRQLDRVIRDLEARQSALETRYDDSGIVGRSPAMIRVLRAMERVTQATVPVLLQGESGTGKELVARTIHYTGPRRAAGFVVVNCAALPPALMDSELFGHRKGAFTDAVDDRQGLVEVASGGTLLFDEIGEMDPTLQVKLLRFMQSGEITPIGSDRPVQVDVRILATSQGSIEPLVEAGRFREDLYYRLNVVTIVIPPLRERREDIPDLARHFVSMFAEQARLDPKPISRRAQELLMGHGWPGNVRELEGVLKNALIMSEGPTIGPQDLALAPHRAQVTSARAQDLSMRSMEEESIRKVLVLTSGNKAEAARMLGVGRMTLYRKMKKYGIEA